MEEPLIIKASAIAKGYRIIPDWLMCRSEISDGAKILYACLLGYGRKDGYAYPPLKKLANDLGRCEREIQKSLVELKKYNLILVNRRTRTSPNQYFFLIHDWMNLSTEQYYKFTRDERMFVSETNKGSSQRRTTVRVDTLYINNKLNNKLNREDFFKMNIKLPMTEEDMIVEAKRLIKTSVEGKRKMLGFEWAAHYLLTRDEEFLKEHIKIDSGDVFGLKRELDAQN